ncbi:type III-A CRISPR-associated RAMP protein Csm5 [uncultured Methanobrevibacter sp.]|uniref:type III-A CRISPR-associated RAMP protein Csm5 n=1 Tax=uncultured Methanobrevibacter sp. TaxID=253161 RepID=UPI0026064A60
MMNQKIGLEVISPVYIGKGSDYSRAEFGLASFSGINKIVRYNLDEVAQLILKNEEDLFDEFINVISDTENFKNRHADKSKVGYYGLQKFLIDKIKPKNPDLYKKIRNSYSYKCTIKYGKNIKYANDIGIIKEHLKTNGGLYIPGSSIKGAIRNAFLYSRLNLNCGNNQIRRAIESMDKNLKNSMKFFHFTDTLNTIDEPSIYGVESIGTRRNTLSFLETIDEGNQFEFEYYNSFNMKIHNRRDLNDFPSDIDSIFKQIHDFSHDLIKEELRFIKKTVPNSNYYDFDNGSLKNFYNELYKKNTVKTPLLRLGHGSGALTVSQLLKIKNSRRNQNQFTEFRSRNGIGKMKKKTGKNKKKEAVNYDFPKTRKLIVDTYKPLGWVQLSKK